MSKQLQNKFVFLYSAFFLLMLSPSFAYCGQWDSMRQGPEGHASITYQGPAVLQEWYYFYKTTQRYHPGLAVWASPALAIIENKPMAFLGGHNQTLLALDLSGKKVQWLKITNGEIAETPAIGQVRGEPIVFFGSADRTLYALRAKTGETLWTHELIPATTTLGAVAISSPVLHDDFLYITCFAYDKSLARQQQNTWLLCLNQKTGKELWRFKIGDGFVSSPVGFTLDGQFHLAVAARKGLLQCFLLENNQPKWIWSYQFPHEVFGSPVVESNRADPLMFLGSKFGNLAALDARSGKRRWQMMAGHWIDNSACLGSIDNKNILFVGSHDYKLYAYAADSGQLLWDKPLGGEIYSAPAFFNFKNEPMVSVACLDDRVYVLHARTGKIEAAYFSGEPIWSKVPKGETLMGSPVAISAGNETAIVHGSYSGIICLFPLTHACMFRNTARSFTSLWLSLPVVLLVFLGIVLPLLFKFTAGKNK